MLNLKVFSSHKLKQISQQFQAEIEKASKKEVSSLAFEKNLLFKNRIKTKKEDLLQIIYIGGSHIESALINPKNQNQILNFKSEKISPLKNSQEFFELIAKYYTPKANFLNLNLAAHLKSIYRKDILDAVLIKNHLEHNLQDLVGKHVGLEVEKYLKQKFNKKITVSSSNNLVSLGFLAKEDKEFESSHTITGVIASGLNFGFYQDNETFINLESGKFKLENEEIAEFFASNNLHNQFNKQAKFLNLKIELKKKEDFERILKNPNKYSLEIGELAKKILQKSAQLVACQFYGIILYKFGQNPILKHKIKLLLEGSLFWDNKIYKETFLKTLEELGLENQKLEIIRIKHGFILGSSSSLYFETKLEKKGYLLIQKIYSVLEKRVNALRGPPVSLPA